MLNFANDNLVLNLAKKEMVLSKEILCNKTLLFNNIYNLTMLFL